MVHLVHRWGGPAGTSVNLTQAELRTPHALIVHSSFDGVALDEREYRHQPQRRDVWCDLRIVLAGSVQSRHMHGDAVDRDEGQDRTLVAGDMVLSDRFRGHSLRWRGFTRQLRVAWRMAGPVHSATRAATQLRLSAGALRTVRDIATELSSSAPTRQARDALARHLLAELAACGVPVSPRGWSDDTSKAHTRVGKAMAEVLCPMSAAPAAVDLARALGCGQRQALRLANDYFKELHVTVRSWREYMVGIRLVLGMMAMTHPKVRTDAVSRWLGFSSPTSLCHAFSINGLPSPRAYALATHRLLATPNTRASNMSAELITSAYLRARK